MGEGQKKDGVRAKKKGERRGGKKVGQVGERRQHDNGERGNKMGGSPATRKRCWRGWQIRFFDSQAPLQLVSESNITLTPAIEKRIKGCWCFPRSSMVW